MEAEWTGPVTHLLPLSSKCSFQYMLCNKQQNSLMYFSFKVSVMLSFLTGHWRDTAGECTFCNFQPGQQAAQHA